MSASPISPRLLKGALVGLDPANPLASVIVFQYNPETLTRTISPQTGAASAGTGASSDAMRLTGPPQENIRLDVVIDATDQLEQGASLATKLGIHPQLAALEMLLYPKSATTIANEALLMAGMIEVVPPSAPLAVFVWGPQRVLPVRLGEFTITEEMFDPLLNPIRARVSLNLRVQNYRDLGLATPGGAMFMVHQVAKEVLATLNTGNTVAAGLAGL